MGPKYLKITKYLSLGLLSGNLSTYTLTISHDEAEYNEQYQRFIAHFVI